MLNFLENESFEVLPRQSKPSFASIVQKPNSSSSVIQDNDQPKSKKPTITTPICYNSPAIIPFNDNSDLTPILTRQTTLPVASTNFFDYLQTEKTKTKLERIIKENDHERETRLQVAKQIQQDFLKSIHLD